MSGSGVQLSDEDARKLLMSLDPRMLEQITQLQHQRLGDQVWPPEFLFLKLSNQFFLNKGRRAGA